MPIDLLSSWAAVEGISIIDNSRAWEDRPSMPSLSSPDPKLLPIYSIRGRRVVLDRDLAALYGVATMAFNQATRRNAARFPADFVFRFTREELTNLKSQIVIPSSESCQDLGLQPRAMGPHGGRRSLPWAFTEHGAIMAATILRSPRAVQMSVYVVRAFVRMREEALTSAAILKRLAEIDKRLLEHDLVLRDMVEKLLPLLSASPKPDPPKRRIGFDAEAS
jgi:hypothetical protein